jgi:hypothetical protein
MDHLTTIGLRLRMCQVVPKLGALASIVAIRTTTISQVSTIFVVLEADNNFDTFLFSQFTRATDVNEY